MLTTTATTASATVLRPCLCGCNTLVAPKKSFVQGHDAKLRGLVLRGAKTPDLAPALTSEARAWLRSAHWMTTTLAAAVAFFPSAN